MKKILNITLAAAFACAMTGCQDFLDTSSPSVVDRDFVFSNEESARGALYYGYETLRANRSVHNVGFFWHPVWGSILFYDHTVKSQGKSHPLVFLNPSIIMGVKIRKSTFLIQWILLQIHPR